MKMTELLPLKVYSFTLRKCLKSNKDSLEKRHICSDVFDKAANIERPGPEVIKLFSCSTQLSMKF